MPHCIIEYSETIEQHIDADTLRDTVFRTVCDSPLFEAHNVRTRLQPYQSFCFGADKSDFIHVTLKIIAGRSDSDKATLCRQVGQAVEQVGVKAMLISCECVDIHASSYFRAET